MVHQHASGPMRVSYGGRYEQVRERALRLATIIGRSYGSHIPYSMAVFRVFHSSYPGRNILLLATCSAVHIDRTPFSQHRAPALLIVCLPYLHYFCRNTAVLACAGGAPPWHQQNSNITSHTIQSHGA